MPNNNKAVYLILALVVLNVIAFFVFKGCDEKPQIKESETREMKAGTPDTVTTRTVDTVWKETKTREIIRIREENLQQFGKDSSRFDTTVTKDGGSIRVSGTTYPAIDSIKLDVASLVKYPEITQTDTILISRVDTLQITKILESATDVPWYDRFWTGVAASAIPVIAYIFLQK